MPNTHIDESRKAPIFVVRSPGVLLAVVGSVSEIGKSGPKWKRYRPHLCSCSPGCARAPRVSWLEADSATTKPCLASSRGKAAKAGDCWREATGSWTTARSGPNFAFLAFGSFI